MTSLKGMEEDRTQLLRYAASKERMLLVTFTEFCWRTVVNRIMEQFGLEGIFRGHLAQPPCSEQGHLQLDQGAQSPIQPDLECFQGWGIYHLSGQPVAVFHRSHCQKFFPNIQSKSTLPQFKTITPCSVTTCPCKKSLSSFLVGPFKYLAGCYQVSPLPSLLQAEQPQLSQPFLTGKVFHPSDHFCGPPLDPLQQVHVLLVLGAPELDTGFEVGSHQSRAEGRNHLPRPAGHSAFDAAQDTMLDFSAVSTHCRLTSRFSSTSTPKAALNSFIPQPVLIPGVAPTHVQDPALEPVEPHE